MPKRQWLSPPRHLLALFVVVTVLPSATLAWLGWRLLEQDSALVSQRLQERLESDATRVAAELHDWLFELRAELAASGEPFTPRPDIGAVVVRFDPEGITAHRPARLLYRPLIDARHANDDDIFVPGEALEFRKRDLENALDAYEDLARQGDSEVRAGALLRIARVQRKLGRLDAALETYGALAALDDAVIERTPASLVAAHARLAILRELGRDNEHEKAAKILATDLANARWQLDRDVYGFYAARIETLPATASAGGLGVAPTASSIALAEAVDLLYQQWRHEELPDSGLNESLLAGNEPILAVAVTADDDVDALHAYIASREHLDARIDRWSASGIAVRLIDSAGHNFVRPIALEDGPRAVRTAAATGLPWDLQVYLNDPQAALAALDGRRTLLFAGLTMILLLVFGGGYFSLRAVIRELAVARLQGDFVSAVSHEFRSPLTSMRHLAELLAEGKVRQEDRRARYYKIICQETSRLHRLVENLLDFRRLESGAFEYRFEREDLAALAAEVVDEFARLSSRDHTIELRSGNDRCDVRIDREALSRALWNLLDNAAKYSPRGSRIRVDIESRDGRAIVSVRDEGIGIGPDESARIFEKFVRGQRSGAERVEGAGIGLTMVQQIVDAHGGEIRIDSVSGSGSVFSIELPLEESSQ